VDTNVLKERVAVIFFPRPQCSGYEWAGNVGWLTGRDYRRKQGDRALSRPMAKYTGKVKIQEHLYRGHNRGME
jgi:hypothetical protein